VVADAKGMKMTPFYLAALAACTLTLQAQTPETNPLTSSTTSARDGFTRSGTSVLFTRRGLTQPIDREITLENGLRVRPDGTVTLPGGEKAALHANQILTLRGTFEDVALTPDGVAPLTSVAGPREPIAEKVARPDSDGVVFSKTGVFVIRKGIAGPLNQELRLSDGTRVMPSGSVFRPNGSEINLRLGQMITFDGAIQEAPAGK